MLRLSETRARSLFDISSFKHALAPRAALEIRLANYASENFFSKTQKSWPKNWGWQADFARRTSRKKSHANRRRRRLLRLLSGAPPARTQKQKSPTRGAAKKSGLMAWLAT